MNLSAIITKSNAGYICQECGSRDNLQAHHCIPHDDSTLICLCAVCHHKRHPNMALRLFTHKQSQPYWRNKSASKLAGELGVCSRTIIRRARKLGIGKGLLPYDKEILLRNEPQFNYQDIIYNSVTSNIQCPSCGGRMVKAGKCKDRQQYKCCRMGCWRTTTKPQIKELEASLEKIAVS